jgi:hypothetical protein
MAIEEGMRLALYWTSNNIRAETDCAEAVELIKENTPNTSAYAFRINVIHELLRKRGTILAKISRDVNAVSHELAKIDRCQQRTELWPTGFPPKIAQSVETDCNPILIYKDFFSLAKKKQTEY